VVSCGDLGIVSSVVQTFETGQLIGSVSRFEDEAPSVITSIMYIRGDKLSMPR
jgi:hypothetical protein